MTLAEWRYSLKTNHSPRTLFSSRWPFIFLPGLILLFFNKMAFSNLILARGDVFLYFYPYWQAASDALRNGRIPLWNPHLFMGAPLLANSQVGFFYPLNWPVWLLFTVPVAVKVSILLHLLIASCGAYLAGKRALGLQKEAALVTGVLFGLSGYLTAQVEHVNQVQGLAWLPWYFVVLATFGPKQETARLRSIGRGAAAFSLLIALQLLAGHTQTLFISGVAVALWALFAADWRRPGPGRKWTIPQTVAAPLLALGLAALMALLLTAVQLLPTLELTRLSSRQGGLPVNEVLSFSLHPLLLGQALLPGYGQSLFSEYIAFFPLTALLLALLGAIRWRAQRGVLPAIMLILIGLLLALGAFNPLNWLLARLPFFNLFRVPARWLALYAFGIAALAGVGWQKVRSPGIGFHESSGEFPGQRPFRLSFFLLPGIMAWAVLAQYLTPLLPTGPESPYAAPNRLTLLLWAVELGFAASWLRFWSSQFSAPALNRSSSFRSAKFTSPILRLYLASFANPLFLTVGTAILFIGSRAHPYNSLTTPDAFFDLRPSISRLLVADCEYQLAAPSLPQAQDCTPTWGQSRFLSLSNIFFDPGDQGEIAAVYGNQLDAAAIYDYVVAIKQKEIISPNLPLTYGLSTVDGFDGGILPTNSYSELVTLILPAGATTTDGRLREQLTAVPAQRWLNLFNARYLITDKTGDQWRHGVFFDLQHPLNLVAGKEVEVGYVPNFLATDLWLLADEAPQATVTTAAGTRTLQAQLLAEGTPSLYQVNFAETAVLQRISLAATEEPVQVAGLALVNEADGSFHALVPGSFRLIHSGDVKIYENLDVLPRAFLIGQWAWQPDSDASLAAMKQPTFSPGETAVLLGEGLNGGSAGAAGVAKIATYEPERVVVHTRSETKALLLLNDANFPGWRVTVDGQMGNLYTANAYFRAVFVPAGEHEVVFTFSPRSFVVGRFLSLIGLGIWAVLAVALLRTRH